MYTICTPIVRDCTNYVFLPATTALKMAAVMEKTKVMDILNQKRDVRFKKKKTHWINPITLTEIDSFKKQF